MELIIVDVAAVARASSRRALSAAGESVAVAHVGSRRVCRRAAVYLVDALLLQPHYLIDTSWPLLCILALQFLDTEWRVKYFLGTLYSDVSGLDNLKRNWETWRRHCDRWNVANRDHDHVCY